MLTYIKNSSILKRVLVGSGMCAIFTVFVFVGDYMGIRYGSLVLYKHYIYEKNMEIVTTSTSFFNLFLMVLGSLFGVIIGSQKNKLNYIFCIGVSILVFLLELFWLSTVGEYNILVLIFLPSLLISLASGIQIGKVKDLK